MSTLLHLYKGKLSYILWHFKQFYLPLHYMTAALSSKSIYIYQASTQYIIPSMLLKCVLTLTLTFSTISKWFILIQNDIINWKRNSFTEKISYSFSSRMCFCISYKFKYILIVYIQVSLTLIFKILPKVKFSRNRLGGRV